MTETATMAVAYQGLSSAEAEKRIKEYGRNEIPEKKKNFFLKVFKWLISPIALMLLGAALLSVWSGKIFDFWFILSLMALNFGASFWQERKADNAVKKLEESLTVQVHVLRDGSWRWMDSKELVPGDMAELMVGDIIPADGEILAAKNLAVNEAVLTGESLPKSKNLKDEVYSGSYTAIGSGIMAVTATGIKTNFGKTISMMEGARKQSILEKDILNISKFLTAIALLGAAIVTATFLFENAPWRDIILLDLSLLIAGIPVSLPTVMTLIISLGALELAKKKTIVRRLSALEDLANVNMLFTDKTGTLSNNLVTVSGVIGYNGWSEGRVVHYASAAAPEDTKSAIDNAINKKATDLGLARDFSVTEFIPGDSERKRSTVSALFNGVKTLVSVGAPQVIEELCEMDAKLKAQYEADVEKAASRGYRVLGVAVRENSEEEKNMSLAGILLLSDPLTSDAAGVIRYLEENGIGVKMLTGDNLAITRRTAEELSLSGQVLPRGESIDPAHFNNISAFSEVLPEDKLNLAKLAKERGYVVAMTGDGVNDLGAIKEANVGIAVKNAVDALKSAADIVLLSPGISVIKDALVEARKIFSRLYSYSLYRVSESFRLIITIVVLGLIYKTYPLTPIQLILIALMNDIPIISMAFDRVKNFSRPAKIKVKERFALGSLYGLAGILNSLILFFLMASVLHLPWDIIQTIFFLKLMVSGHMLIYVAHTKERWYKFLPSSQVIWATTITQIVASLMAFFGIFMASIPLLYIVGVWLWSFLWMQISELAKILDQKFVVPKLEE